MGSKDGAWAMVVTDSIESVKLKFQKNLHSVNDLSCDEISDLFSRADSFSQRKKSTLSSLCKPFIFASLFFQVSTRTRLSFEAAAQLIGGKVITVSDVSATRSGDFFQETLSDAVILASKYADCMVVRSSEENLLNKVSQHVTIPTINGGDGNNEHPTQALLDLWMLKRLFPDGLSNTRLGLVGDPNCRDFRSFFYLLSRYQLKNIVLLAPDHVDPQSCHSWLGGNQLDIVLHIDDLLVSCDAVCMLPFKLPTFKSPWDAADLTQSHLKDCHTITQERLDKHGQDCPFILHVGPRTAELPPTLHHPQILYYKQIEAGLYLRAALISYMLEGLDL